jgi:hypothetical protein
MSNMAVARTRQAGKRLASVPARPSVPIGEIYRGHRRLSLIRDLAMGELSSAEIARAMGLDTRDIENFRETFRIEISEVRAALAGRLAIETAGLWISKKQNRVAELQADVDEINAQLQAMRDVTLSGADRVIKEEIGMGSRQWQTMMRMKQNIMKLVADEYSARGEAKDRAEDDDRNVVHYVIEMDDSIKGALT